MKSLNLREKSLRTTRYGEDADPMASLANLADVMLVFACGLMLSLITYWQIDVSAVSEILPDNKISEIESPEDITNQLNNMDGSSYLDMGRVYMDPVTGKYYMIVDNNSAQAEALEGSLAQSDAAGAAANTSGTTGAEGANNTAATSTPTSQETGAAETTTTAQTAAADRNTESAAEGSVLSEGD